MPAYSNPKILLAEDEEAVAKFFELKLKVAGFDVQVAEDGQKALKATEKEKFDVIIVDIIMPKMNGYDFIKKVREKGNAVPIIVSSNLGQKEDRERAKSSGASEYFVKASLSFAELIFLVKKCLNQDVSK
jgi:DNA-binding response OmpR family regulator